MTTGINFKGHKPDHMTKCSQQISFLLNIYPYILWGIIIYNTVLKLWPELLAHSFELSWARPKPLLGQHLGLGLAQLVALSWAGHITKPGLWGSAQAFQTSGWAQAIWKPCTRLSFSRLWGLGFAGLAAWGSLAHTPGRRIFYYVWPFRPLSCAGDKWPKRPSHARTFPHKSWFSRCFLIQSKNSSPLPFSCTLSAFHRKSFC